MFFYVCCDLLMRKDRNYWNDTNELVKLLQKNVLLHNKQCYNINEAFLNIEIMCLLSIYSTQQAVPYKVESEKCNEGF